MKKAFLFVLAGLSLLFVPLSLVADSHEAKPPSLVDMWIVVPKQGMESEFEDAVKMHMAFRTEAGDSRDWQAYGPAIGKNLRQYAFRACCFDWADQDSYVIESRENGYGEHWNENVHEFVDHYHHYMGRLDLEHSYWPDDAPDFKYFGVTAWTWKENAGPESSDARKEMSKLALDGGWGERGRYWSWESQIGGSPTLVIVIPYENYAGMEPPEQTFYDFVVEELGSEKKADELFARFSSGFASSDYTVWVHLPDLSAPDDMQARQ